MAYNHKENMRIVEENRNNTIVSVAEMDKLGLCGNLFADDMYKDIPYNIYAPEEEENPYMEIKYWDCDLSEYIAPNKVKYDFAKTLDENIKNALEVVYEDIDKASEDKDEVPGFASMADFWTWKEGGRR